MEQTKVLGISRNWFGFRHGWFAEWQRRRQIRASYGRLTDDMLRDAGLTRGDVDAALALPLSKRADAALELASVGQGRW